MDELFARIGGFNMLIKFTTESIDSRIAYLKNKAEIDLLIYLRNFLVLSKPKKNDFEKYMKTR